VLWNIHGRRQRPVCGTTHGCSRCPNCFVRFPMRHVRARLLPRSAYFLLIPLANTPSEFNRDLPEEVTLFPSGHGRGYPEPLRQPEGRSWPAEPGRCRTKIMPRDGSCRLFTIGRSPNLKPGRARPEGWPNGREVETFTMTMFERALPRAFYRIQRGIGPGYLHRKARATITVAPVDFWTVVALVRWKSGLAGHGHVPAEHRREKPGQDRLDTIFRASELSRGLVSRPADPAVHGGVRRPVAYVKDASPMFFDAWVYTSCEETAAMVFRKRAERGRPWAATNRPPSCSISPGDDLNATTRDVENRDYDGRERGP